MSYDLLVVGAGISGLYVAYRYLCGHPTARVHLIEKRDRLGGKIHTKTIHHLSYESGAGRISSHYRLLLKLIRELHLSPSLLPIKGEMHPVFHTHQVMSSLGPFIDRILAHARTYRKRELIQMSYLDFLQEIFTPMEFDTFRVTYGYPTYVNSVNAYYGCLDMKHTLQTSYYVLRGGLSTIISHLWVQIQQRGGTLSTGESFLQYTSTSHSGVMVTTTKGIYQTRSLSLHLSPSECHHVHLSFPFFSEIQSIPLCRIYYYYAQPTLPVTLSKMVTDTDLGFIIPLHPQLIMISYTDGELATEWSRCTKTQIKEKIQRITQRQLHLDIPPPNKVIVEYWPHATHAWKPTGHFSIKHIHPEPHVYLCNEAYSEKQGWIEGSLEVAEKVLQFL